MSDGPERRVQVEKDTVRWLSQERSTRELEFRSLRGPTGIDAVIGSVGPQGPEGSPELDGATGPAGSAGVVGTYVREVSGAVLKLPNGLL